MKLLNREIKLAIFDLDGTLINSTSLWADIDKEFFARRNMEVPEKYAKEIAHLGLKKAAEITKKLYCPNENEEDIIAEWNYYAQKAYEEDITIKDHALELIKKLKSFGVYIALATANSKELYLPCIKRLGIDKYLDYLIDVNSCKSGKNTTEIYDRATEHFHLENKDVVIFEDLLEPIKVAVSGGYLVIGVYDPHSISNIEEHKKHPHLFIRSFKEIIDLME